MKLSIDFYRQEDVTVISRELLGKTLFTRFNGKLTGGIITETEAYDGPSDRASHAFNNRRTARTEIMYNAGGVAYVYLCYGIHSLFNIVTGKKEIPQAVLIRNVKPAEGISIMEKRRGKKIADRHFCTGPGTVSTILGINCQHNGTSLMGDFIWIEETRKDAVDKKIKTTPRIGVDYAGKDALLPYRFVLEI